MPSTDKQDIKNTNWQDTEKQRDLHDTGKDYNYQQGTYQDETRGSNFRDTNLQEDRKNIEDKDKLLKKQEKVESSLSDYQKRTNESLKMEGLLSQVHESLKLFFHPEVDVNKQIPPKILSGAKGFIFLRMMKTGVIVGNATGTGFIITRLEGGHDRKWSGPCAIGLSGVQWGLNFGEKIIDYFIVLRDSYPLEVFSKKGQLKFGTDATISSGPEGRDAFVPMSYNDKGYTPIVCYAMTKGFNVGTSLDNQIIVLRDDCNEEFYREKVDPWTIFKGSFKVPQNEDFNSICKILDNELYTHQNLQYTQQ